MMLIFTNLQTIKNSVLLVLSLTIKIAHAADFVDITADSFVDGQYTGLIAAFGDFNSDKLTDVFCIGADGKTIEVLLAHSEKPYLRSSKVFCTMNGSISAVMPGDFNGDSMMDVMLFQTESNDVNEAKVLWGFYDHLSCTNTSVFRTHGLPFLVDFNGDMIPDLLGEDESNRRSVWVAGGSNKTFSKAFVHLNTTLQPIRIPHSSAVVDADGDMVSDIIITGKDDIEVWLNHGNVFTKSHSISYPIDSAGLRGQSTFVDFNCDGKLDHILPICSNSKCDSHSSCKVMIQYNETSEWLSLLDNFDFRNVSWCFKPGEFGKFVTPITLRAGDYDMDGYPDFIALIKSSTSEDTKMVLLQNIPFENSIGRGLSVQWEVPGLTGISAVHIATFYDLFEDGKMDILLSHEVGSKLEVRVLHNVHIYDACFFKVLVLSGLCYTDCPKDKIPYGTNQPGPMIIYHTTKPDGNQIAGCAVQMPQSAYSPLQLPYSVFGLGPTPNFVDHLTVSITSQLNNQTHKREWSQIIPNSQMVVIPHPPGNEQKWVNKLFVTPSHLVLLTFLALVGTCGFIAILVAILHWKERREDKLEKMQDAYRFHFDAM